MELFGLLFAVPVTFAASLVYACVIISAGRRWPAVRLALLMSAGCIGACILAEAVVLGTFGAKEAYAHLRHVFTAIHFVNFLLAPPAVAHIAFYVAARLTHRAWLQFVAVVPCCWLACMSVVVGHIVIDEAIVGPDARKPFYLTGEAGPNPPASVDGGITSQLHIGRTWPSTPEQDRWATLQT